MSIPFKESLNHKPTNRIQHEFHSKMDLTIQLTMELMVYSIQRRIQALNQQIGFNVSSIQ